MKDMQAYEILKNLYESSMNKSKKLQLKMKSEALSEKLKSICLVFSFMLNMYLLLKCQC